MKVWTRVNLSETMPGPVSPMGWSLLETGIRVMFRPLRISNDAGYSLFAFHYGRVYWDLTPIFGSRFLFKRLDESLEMIGPSIRPVFQSLYGRVHPRPIYTIPQKLVLGLQALFAIPRVAAHVALTSIDRGLESLEADLRKPVETQSTRSDERIRELERYLRRGYEGIKFRYGPAGILVLALAGPFLGLGARLMKSNSLVETLGLMTPPRPSKTAAANLALWAAARQGKEDFLAALTLYGHRCPGEQDAYAERPWDDPDKAWERTRVDDSNPSARFDERVRTSREAAEARFKSMGFLRRLIARPLHRLASRVYPYREDGKHYVMLLFGHARRRLISIGQALQAEGVLSNSDDVFFVTLQELSRRDFSRIAERRAEFERWRDYPAPLVLTSEGVPEIPFQPLRGDPVSPGVARGRARVVLDPAQGGLEADEILVAPFTDPGWTPLFLRAAAVVTEVGGALSHGAVVAREFGLPAVVNVANATTLLRSGDAIEVDGGTGEIRRL